MIKAGSKIFGIFFFIALVSFLFYLILLPKKIIKKHINKIELSGNKFLIENDYLQQAKLSDVKNYNDLPLSVIKDRLEKHPYISRADVELKGNKILAYVTERKMIAIIIKKTDLYFVSDNFEILPFMPKTKLIDLPVITNPAKNDNLKPFAYIKSNGLLDALKIIESIKLTNQGILNHLSEINLRNGGDIILTFSGYPVPVIFGRGEEVRKMVYLEGLWENKDLNNMIKNSSYIDLRFAGNIYAGSESNGQITGKIE
ncbi:MAG: cell division protein FtsQ/DivIB [Ignavibacteriaceae bacterium]